MSHICGRQYCAGCDKKLCIQASAVRLAKELGIAIKCDVLDINPDEVE